MHSSSRAAPVSESPAPVPPATSPLFATARQRRGSRSVSSSLLTAAAAPAAAWGSSLSCSSRRRGNVSSTRAPPRPSHAHHCLHLTLDQQVAHRGSRRGRYVRARRSPRSLIKSSCPLPRTHAIRARLPAQPAQTAQSTVAPAGTLATAGFVNSYLLRCKFYFVFSHSSSTTQITSASFVDPFTVTCLSSRQST